MMSSHTSTLTILAVLLVDVEVLPQQLWRSEWRDRVPLHNVLLPLLLVFNVQFRILTLQSESVVLLWKDFLCIKMPPIATAVAGPVVTVATKQSETPHSR